MDFYDLSFQVVRFPISEYTYECIVTNLPEDEFIPKKIKLMYLARWAIKSSFRKLKYTIGLSNFHEYKPKYFKQKIWAKLIAYSITEALINHAVVNYSKTKHEYNTNFNVAAHICKVFLRLTADKAPIDVMNLLCKEFFPVRNERQYPKLQMSQFQRSRYFIYHATSTGNFITNYYTFL